MLAQWEDDGLYGCTWCGGDSDRMQMDHVRPTSKGGPDVVGNLAPACPDCNRAKADADPVPFWLDAMDARGLDVDRALKNLRKKFV